ncbi:NAD(P)H-dependent oxidoreductase [Pseudoalteromonas sp. G4]|uniref:NAD(P)H-dependent oxidoreductase n=1 Tax=Pseudoalteromonas sp. G4 TaxID=2992761 RepID=UPI00237EC4A4|nr:NAD(P)H-dependent oxidoreductase [Pseudoalteromonas sp. G4]MDE3273945.1 NAD(P)H-dependent oxidoreductase [Pseudoalteromonas sp. G4]
MKIYLVVAHPEQDSFNFALHNTAVGVLKNANIRFDVSDLYGQNFNPVAGRGDTTNFPAGDLFQLAKAQRLALSSNSFVNSISQEQEKLVSSDLLIFQFPLWWWSFPGILKGWIDRVLTSGFAYGHNAILKPKKVMYSITTGGADSKEELDYYQNKIDGLYQDIFGFMRWEILPAFIAHGVQQKTHDERQQILASYQEHLKMVLRISNT